MIMARPTAHVLTLLELLQSGGTRTAAELAGRLGVDERTVRRYVDHLTDLGIPVESVRGRYGGYRLAPGYRLPPLMLTDDEALAILLGLMAARRAGLTAGAGTPGAGTPGAGTPGAGTAGAAADTAAETAAAKIRRVLPARLASQIGAVLESAAFTAPAGPGSSGPEATVPETAVLLATADAVRHHRPVSLRYTDASGRRSERILHPYGLVAHSGRWYVTGADLATEQERTFRLDRIADVRVRPGSFEPPEGLDPAQRLLQRFATAPYRHHVIVRIDGTVEQIRTRFPASVATVASAASVEGGPLAEHPVSALGDDPRAGQWPRVELRAEKLDWIPPLLASLDLPFVIEQPGELRDRVAALAERLAASARRGGRPLPRTAAFVHPVIAGELHLELGGHLIAELQGAEEPGVRGDPEVRLPHRHAPPVLPRRRGQHLEPGRLRPPVQGQRPLDRPAAGFRDHPNRGEGGGRGPQDLADGFLDLPAVPVGERLRAAAPFPDRQRAEVELGPDGRRREPAAGRVRHDDFGRPPGHLERQVVAHPGGHADAACLDEHPAGLSRARDECSR
jgi:predicted DNA-binding transcriptional regulator YafY